ncbi:MAG: FkbM family methyltransferase [Pseudorhodoplanes sp.]
MSNVLFENVTLHCVDLGARAGIPDHWQPFAAMLTIDAFEPDETALDKGYRQMDRVAWFPFGLAGQSGKLPFYITGVASGSSLYPPNEPVIGLYTSPRYYRIAETRQLPFLTFSDFLREYQRPKPEMIKLDTQGSELDILRSLEPADWSALIAVETEVEFAELYAGQPLFRDVDVFMAKRGFDLVDLRTHRSYLQSQDRAHHYLRAYLDFAGPRSDLSARLLAGDALYMRRYPDGLPPDAMSTRKLVVVYCIYRFFDHAFALVERAVAAGQFSAAEGNALISHIRRAGPRPRLLERASGIARRVHAGVLHVLSKGLRMIGRRLPRRGRSHAGWMTRAWPDQ